MRIVLVHYHLRPGGVTSVVLNQARALAKTGAELLIIAGEAVPPDFGFPFTLIKDLAYNQTEPALSRTEQAKGVERLAAGILRAIEERWHGSADIVHVHNPLIQKNSLLIPALKLLVGRGVRLFLQNHDLAEDFRPDVYTGDVDYPENCHYGVINSRDYDCLRRAGLEAEGLHLIPNEVSSMRASPGLERTRYLYPVRAIRRKNIGEALFLSLFIPKGRTVAITLPPSEKDAAPYRRWHAFAAELGLPVEFELGLRYSLADLLGSSVRALSTSVKEGFGFSFLEPWTAGRGLFGRRVEYVCADFERAGVRFDGLYSSLEVPLEYLGGAANNAVSGLEQKMESAMRRIYRSFALEAPERVMRALAEDLRGRETIDFGRLDEELQESLIRACHGNPSALRHTTAINPLLEALGDGQEDEELIEANRRVIAEQYGSDRIVKLLLKIYQTVLDHQVSQRISKSTLLELYLDPLRLSLVGISDG
ncbi:MAG: glycosyltransferase family 1 protein [Treponema sp.]|nr:glycosyltransferase family 1 protein [Treponema sp.]